MTRRAREAVLERVARNRDDAVEFARLLVRTPSIVGSEGAAQRVMRGAFESMGLETRLVTAEKAALALHPAACETPWPYEGRPNVCGLHRGAAPGKTLILNGHIDVVTPEPVSLWAHDPWGAEIEGGRLYGRGAWDMKAGLAAMTFAVRAVREAGVGLSGDIALQSVIEEETGGAGGALALVLAGETGDAAIVPEPSRLKVWLASNGVCYFRVGIEGRTAHPMHAKSGVDAVEKAVLVRSALMTLRDRRRAEVTYPLFSGESDYACDINVGVVRAGDWPSAVPGWAEMECRVSFIPGERMADIRALIEGAIAEAAARDPWLSAHPPAVTWYGWKAEPSELSPQEPIVTHLKAACREAAGFEPLDGGFAGGLDTRLLMREGGIPAFCFGPRGDCIHGIDEYVLVEDIETVTKVLAATAVDYLGVA